MAEPKTKPTNVSVSSFLNAIANETRRKDAKTVHKIMREVTGLRARMWGPSIVGFGSVDYAYASGHSGTCAIIGFAPRKANLVIYLLDGPDTYAPLLTKLGPHKTGRACLYLTRLDTVDVEVLREIIAASFRHVTTTNVGRVTLS